MNIDQQVALMREKGFVFDDHYKIRGIMLTTPTLSVWLMTPQW